MSTRAAREAIALLPQILSDCDDMAVAQSLSAGAVRDRLFLLGWPRRDGDDDDKSSPSSSRKVWKLNKDEIAAAWSALISPADEEEEESESEEEEKPQTKYDRMAVKNYRTFMAATVGDLIGDLAGQEGAHSETEASGSGSAVAENDDEPDDESDASTSSSPPKKKTRKSSSKEVVPGEVWKKRGQGSKSKRASSSGAFKSSVQVDDSDDSSHEQPSAFRADTTNDDPLDGRKKGKAKLTTASKSKGKRQKAAERKPPKSKEGDAPAGSQAEEDRVRKLKDLLKAAGVARPFTATTGAERTLPIKERLVILEDKLNELGLKCGSGVGTSMPSLKKAQELGEKRAIEQELEDLRGTSSPLASGLASGCTRTRMMMTGAGSRRNKRTRL